jgi:Fanconi anemia group M protein
MEFIKHALLKENSVEKRTYQVRLVTSCLFDNTLISIPTGLGKTVIALLAIVKFLEKYPNKSCLITAPTRPLVHQHYLLLKEKINLPENEIAFITGEEQRRFRAWKWSKKVVCATPQVVVNDARRGTIKFQNYSLIVFDEAHKAVGHHAYKVIASYASQQNPSIRFVAMTASIPSDRQKFSEIMKNLFIKKVEVRDEKSKDVKPYIPETEIEWIKVNLPQVMKNVRDRLKDAIKSRLEAIESLGTIEVTNKSNVGMSELLSLREVIVDAPYQAKVALLSAIRLSHALMHLETQSLSSFVNFMNKAFSKKRSPATRDLVKDSRVVEAYEIARGAYLAGIEHPKLEKLFKILKDIKENERAIVFASYRTSVLSIENYLKGKGIKINHLIGRAGEEGQTQKEQIQTLRRFKEGDFNVLVATQVGEEGLDVAECNLVIFYDNVPSAIRFIQRKGRTGRRIAGKVIVLITKGTRDEAYYWVGRKKVRIARSLVKTIKRKEETLTLEDFIDWNEVK